MPQAPRGVRGACASCPIEGGWDKEGLELLSEDQLLLQLGAEAKAAMTEPAVAEAVIVETAVAEAAVTKATASSREAPMTETAIAMTEGFLLEELLLELPAADIDQQVFGAFLLTRNVGAIDCW